MTDSCIPRAMDPGAITSGSSGSKFLEPGLHAWNPELAAGRDVSFLLTRQEILFLYLPNHCPRDSPETRGFPD